MLLSLCCIFNDSIGQIKSESTDRSELDASEVKKREGQELLDRSKEKWRGAVKEVIDKEIEEARLRLAPLAEILKQGRRDLRTLSKIHPFFRPLGNELALSEASTELALFIQSIEKVEAEIKHLDENRETLLEAEAWTKLTQEQRKFVLNSGCLSKEQDEALRKIVDVPNLDGIPSELNSIGMRLRKIPSGSFRMGGIGSGLLGNMDKRDVQINRQIWMAVTETTEDQYRAVISDGAALLPSFWSVLVGAQSDAKGFPVAEVSWYSAVKFCKTLSELPEEIKAGNFYRLPTEAEWEYACKAGSTSTFHFGEFNGTMKLGANLNWKQVESDKSARSIRVQTYAPNKFGLYDMHGNVAEWCGDWFVHDYYLKAPNTDPPGPAECSVELDFSYNHLPYRPKEDALKKVTRGGSYDSFPLFDTGTSVARGKSVPTGSWKSLGFRVVCEKGKASPITQSQYQELRDFEEGKPNVSYQKAFKKYVDTIVAVKKQTDEEISRLSQKADRAKSGLYELSKSQSKMSDILSMMAAEYAIAKDSNRAKNAYLEAAKWAEKALGTATLDNNSEPLNADHYLYQVSNAYHRGGFDEQALRHVDQILAKNPKDSSATSIKKEIDEKNQIRAKQESP